MRAAPRPCTWPGCTVLTDAGRCERHRAVARAELDARRGSAAARGYDARWRRARAHYLQHHPLCAHCERAGRVVAATVVDHITPHRGNAVLMWDEANWQPLCKPCHDTKTATQDGGYGRAAPRYICNHFSTRGVPSHVNASR